MIVREGLRSLLQAEAGIKVVGEAQTGRQAVQLTKELRPDVLVMDIAMPLLNGLEATRQILKSVPATKVLILSAHSDDVEQVIGLGAAGYLLKQTSLEDLSKAIRGAHKGNKFFSPTIARRFRHHDRKLPDRKEHLSKRVPRPTSRELEALQLIAEGKANKQTAAELGLSIKMVEKHRQNLMAKLNIHEISGLTRYAIAAGIVESSVQLTIR
ncbi:MAG TPA: response regulator transcription factor [Verrucomicrobiae bacterium]|nr:response regulator transcription factor [Verrucomicrobiae bacterium]